MRNKITFTKDGIVQCVLFNNVNNEQDAIDIASMHFGGEWDNLIFERME